jgi:hypothetical protein
MEIVKDVVIRPTARSMALPPVFVLVMALRFLASGSFLQVIGDTFQGVGHGFRKSTVHGCVHTICQLLVTKIRDFVHMPSQLECLLQDERQILNFHYFSCALP